MLKTKIEILNILNGFKSLPSLLLVLFFCSSNSQALDKLKPLTPAFCKKIPGLSPEELNSEPDHSISYTTCVNNKPFSLKLSEMSKYMKDIQKESLDHMGNQFSKRLEQVAIDKILDLRLAYGGLFPGQEYPEASELKECLNKRNDPYEDNYNPKLNKTFTRNTTKLERSKYSEEDQKAMISISMINAIKAKVLFKKNKDHYKNIDKSNLRYTQDKNVCRRLEDQCRRGLDIWEAPKVCMENSEKCNAKAMTDKQTRMDAINKKAAPLFGMVQNNALLFKNSNEDKLFAPFHDSELAPSSFLETLTSDVPADVMADMEKAIESKDKNALLSFTNKNKGKLVSLIENKDNYKRYLDAGETAVDKRLKDLNKASAEICNSEGETLHHYPGLVNKTLNEMLNKTNKYLLKHQGITAQAGYCHLLNKTPINDDRISYSAVAGFGLLAGGAILQFAVGPGTIAVTAMIGTATMLAGGTILTGKGIYDYLESDQIYNQELGLYSAGFQSYNKLAASKDKRDSNLAWSIADGALLPFDLLFALKVVKGKPTMQGRTEISENINEAGKQTGETAGEAYKKEGEITLFGDDGMADEVIELDINSLPGKQLYKDNELPLDEALEKLREKFVTDNVEKTQWVAGRNSELSTPIIANGKRINLGGQSVKVKELLGSGAEGTVYLVEGKGGKLSTYKVFHDREKYLSGIEDYNSFKAKSIPGVNIQRLDESENAILLDYVHGVPPQQIINNGRMYGIPESEIEEIRKAHFEFYQKHNIEPVEGNILYDIKTKEFIVTDLY